MCWWRLWGVCVLGAGAGRRRGCHQYPVSLEVNRRTSYIPSVYSLQYLYFYLFLNIHKITKLGSKYTTSLVVKCQISHTTSSRKANIPHPKTTILASKVKLSQQFRFLNQRKTYSKYVCKVLPLNKMLHSGLCGM